MVPNVVRGVVAIVLIVASASALRACQEAPRRTLASAGQALHDALGPLFVGEVTTRFISMAPELSGGSALELATLKVPEQLEREQVRRFLGLESRTGVRIVVPVTYRYHVPWDHGWKVTLTVVPAGTADKAGVDRAARTDVSFAPAGGGADLPVTQLCLVEAPALQPTLPPAIDTRALRIERTKDWALQRIPPAMVDSLLVRITPFTSERAASTQYKALVREKARQRLAQFVRLWVLRQDEVDLQRPVQVIVRFADDNDDVLGMSDASSGLGPIEIR